MSIGVPEPTPGTGVTVAEVNLKLIWDVVSRIQVGEAGYAYVVDEGGQLVAHPDLSLVLQRADLSGLAQVQAGQGPEPTIALDRTGRQVLTARAVIDRPSWSVFVEQPLEEAFAPLYALLGRTALVLLGGLALSVLASLILARRMTQPIRQLQAGAAHIGSGGLDYRIDVRTGDELEVLGSAFNDMTGRLQESYATLEQKVDERTRDLGEALQRLRALGAVSEAVSSTLDLQEVLTTILAHAVQLSSADAGAIYEYDESAREFRLRATHGSSQAALVASESARLGLGESIVGHAASQRRVIQIADVWEEPPSTLRDVVEPGGYRRCSPYPCCATSASSAVSSSAALRRACLTRTRSSCCRRSPVNRCWRSRTRVCFRSSSRRVDNWRTPAATSPSFWPTCRTSCARR